MKLDLSSFFVYESDGSLDISSTVDKVDAKVVEMLVELEKKRKESYSTIAPLVVQIFDETPGASCGVGFLVGEVVRRLGSAVTKDNWSETDKKIREFLKDQEAIGVLKTKAGRNGGIFRVADAKKDT